MSTLIHRFTDNLGRKSLIGVPYLWLLALFLAPFLIVLKISFSEVRLGMPPYEPIVGLVDGVFLQIQLNLENYLIIFEDDIYVRAYLNSLKIAAIATALTFLVGYPLAYGIARMAPGARSILLFLVILPFWTSLLIRVYAWIGILKTDGLLNNLLMSIGLISEPLRIMNTDTAVYIGIVYTYLPFMILPLYATLEKLDLTLVEAARDLGCTPIAAFWKVTFPLSMPGVVAGCALVFIPAIGEFVIPDLLGGADTLMIGRTMWLEFFNNRDWPVASAITVILVAILVIPIVMFQARLARQNA